VNVLVIAEDFRKDQYLLKPLFTRLFSEIGRPRARVEVCKDPLLGGLAEALKTERLSEIVQRYDGMTDIYLLCVDRDGVATRRQRLDQIEGGFGAGRRFLAENAWEELETWALAGLDLPPEWRWADVRSAVHVKETYFEPLAQIRGAADGPGGGRKALGEEAARRIQAIRQKCPDDFDALAQRIEQIIRTS
jgi:hypothetical protein